MTTTKDIIPNNTGKSNDTVDTEMILKQALGYARLGWRVFPLHSIVDGKCTCGNPECRNAGKHPKVVNGFKSATTDTETVHTLFTTLGVCNIGIATGKESNLFVLDVDGEEGKQTLEDLIGEYGELPHTVMALTGGGGEHYFFQYQDGVKNKSNFMPKLDIRGEGGYIVAPISMHSSGNRYEFELSSRPIENE